MSCIKRVNYCQCLVFSELRLVVSIVAIDLPRQKDRHKSSSKDCHEILFLGSAKIAFLAGARHDLAGPPLQPTGNLAGFEVVLLRTGW